MDVPMSFLKMDEKTEELRDIFLSVSDEETVTESQVESHGSLTDEGASVETRLGEIIETLRGKFGFETTLDDEQRRVVIEQFYDDTPDEQLAEELGCDEQTVFTARMELHLVRDSEPPLDGSDRDTVRDTPAADPAELAEQLGTDEQSVRRTRAVFETEEQSRRASQRFVTAYREILTDTDLTSQFATETLDDGLGDATDGAETNVDF